MLWNICAHTHTHTHADRQVNRQLNKSINNQFKVEERETMNQKGIKK